MKHIVLLYTILTVATVAENSQRKLLQTAWEFNLVRRIIETDITAVTIEVNTFSQCALSCSTLIELEAESWYFEPDTKTCHCNIDVDTSPEDEKAVEVYYGILQDFYKKELINEEYSRNTVWPYKKDCLTLYETAHIEDGMYTIDPTGGAVTYTWCDMTNGGWTVIQRREDGSENFYRGWLDYVNGFGNSAGDFWLGLDNIHGLTQYGSHLEIYLEAFPGVTPLSLTAEYTSFVVGSSASSYTLHVTGFTGSCGDAMAFHNGSRFSTFDNDNDVHTSRNCAESYHGGWWYRSCHEANLNGRYYQDGEYSETTSTLGTGIHWLQCWTSAYSLKFSLLKIKSE